MTKDVIFDLMLEEEQIPVSLHLLRINEQSSIVEICVHQDTIPRLVVWMVSRVIAGKILHQ